MATTLLESALISEVQRSSHKHHRYLADENTDSLKTKPNGDITIPSRDARSSLSHAARVALALNDDCCDIGVGKIYLWTIHEPNEDLRSNKQAYAAWCAMPQLVYLSQRWDKEMQERWRSQTTQERLCDMMVQGNVLSSMMVIGIRIEEFGTFNHKIKLDGYTEAPVTIVMSPSTYIGPTRMMQEMLTYGSSQSLLITETPSGNAEHCGYLSDIDLFKVNNLAGDGRSVIEWLELHSCDLKLLGSLDKLFPSVSIGAKQTKNIDSTVYSKTPIILLR